MHASNRSPGVWNSVVLTCNPSFITLDRGSKIARPQQFWHIDRRTWGTAAAQHRGLILIHKLIPLGADGAGGKPRPPRTAVPYRQR